ncbi:radical SAM protein [Propionispira raffinosivorans]|uniref:radical SAM protein n=1 Tax=Propionispira raffinosivorans TaxID=86959 RepID=UPI00036BEF53|nr:radical SAM protein [Propionispira raffinosivorans]
MLPNKARSLDFSWEEIQAARHEKKLLSIDLELSKACNLKCVYCYAESGIKKEHELNLTEIFSVIDQAVELGVKRIVIIGGGEPLIYPDYWKVVHKINECKIPSITITNGTCITADTAKRLYDEKQDIALKWNSFNNTLQDELAGNISGTGEKIKQALKFLVDAGYSSKKKNTPQLALQTVICKKNYNEIEQIYHFCRENNFIPFIEILAIQGYATTHEKDLAVTPHECKILFEKLHEYDLKHWGYDWPIIPPVIGQSCLRMYYSAYLTADGEVQPCGGVTISGGNIRTTLLKEIIHQSEIFNQVRNIDSLIKEPCKKCIYKKDNNCYGCRGKSYQHTGDLFHGDTTCWQY